MRNWGLGTGATDPKFELKLNREYERTDHLEQRGILLEAVGFAENWPYNSCVRMTLAATISEWAATEVLNTWLQQAAQQ